MTTVFIGSISKSYRRKAEEIHRKMHENGDLETAIDEKGNRVCRKCGLVIESLKSISGE